MIHANWDFLVKKHFDFTKTNIPEIGNKLTAKVLNRIQFEIRSFVDYCSLFTVYCSLLE